MIGFDFHFDFYLISIGRPLSIDSVATSGLNSWQHYSDGLDSWQPTDLIVEAGLILSRTFQAGIRGSADRLNKGGWTSSLTQPKILHAGA